MGDNIMTADEERVYRYVSRKLAQKKNYVCPSWAQKDLQISRNGFLDILKELKKKGYVTLDWSRLHDDNHIYFGWGAAKPQAAVEPMRVPSMNPSVIEDSIVGLFRAVDKPVDNRSDDRKSDDRKSDDRKSDDRKPAERPQEKRGGYELTERDRKNLDLLDWLFNGMRNFG